MMHPVLKIFSFLLIGLTIALTGCGDAADGPGEIVGDSDGKAPVARRIVSLAPALTRMVVDLGMSPSLVGVGDNDDALPADKNLPSVGPFPNVNSEMLISLKPTHVLVMAGAEGIPTSLDSLASAHDFKIVSFPYPNSVRDVSTILMGEFSQETGTLVSESSLGSALGNEYLAFSLATAINAELAKIADVTHVIPYEKKPRVLVVFQTTPRLTAAGPGTVLHDLLTQYCRAENAAIPSMKAPKDIYDPKQVSQANIDPASQVGTAPTFDKEKLLNAKPDVIVLMLPGEPPLTTIDDDPRLISLRGLDIPAVKNNRIVLVSDALALLPSSSLPKTALAMSKAIHPQLADQLDQATAPSETAEPAEGDNAVNPTDGKAVPAGESKDGKSEKKSGTELIAPVDSSGNPAKESTVDTGKSKSSAGVDTNKISND